MVKNVPEYMAINPSNTFYVIPTESDLQTIKHSVLKLPLISVSYPSCPVAIFMNEKKLIPDACDFRYLENLVKPSILPIGKTPKGQKGKWG